jgi:PAS domain S-box-containing protein
MFNIRNLFILLLILVILCPALVFARDPLIVPLEDRLTAEERQWIAEHPVINVRISRDYPPFEFYDDGQFAGIAFDYLQLIAEQTGLKFKPTPDMPWKEALQRIEKKKGVDLILLITYREERESFLNFTEDYISFPEVIFTRKDRLFVSGTKDLIGRTVATENDFISAKLIKRDIPDVKILEVDTTEQALQAVALGEADAYIGNLAVGTFLIDKLGLVDLKIAASADYDDDSYAMGIRKDWPELKSILEKGLDSFTAADHQSLKKKWFVLRYEHGIHPADVLMWVFFVAALALAVIFWLNNKLNRKLRESETKFRAILNHHYQLTGLMGPDGKLLMANETALKMAGVKESEVVGQYFWDTYWWQHSPEHQDKLKDAVKRCAQGEFVRFETTHKDMNGDIRNIDISFTPLSMSGQGKVDYIIPEGRDITELKEATIALQESENYFRTVIQASPDVIALVRTADGCMIDGNDVAFETFGFNREDKGGERSLVKSNLWEDPFERELFVNELTKRGRVDNFVAKFKVRGGGIITALVAARAFEYKGEACHLAFFKDISMIQQANDALKDSEGMYRRLSQEFEAVLDGIVDSIVLMDRERHVLWGNRGAALQFGCSQDELTGKTCMQLWDCADQVDCPECVAGVFATGEAMETVRAGDDGKTWGVKGYPVFDRDGQVQNVIQIASDLSEKMQLREEASRAAHLAALGSLSAGIAHEINNPTGLVLMTLPFVKDSIQDLLPLMDDYVKNHPGFKVAGLPYASFREEIVQAVDDMQGGALRVKRIVEDLKDFARERPRDEAELVDLQQVIERSLRLLRNVVNNSTDNFTVEVEDNLPQVKGSAQRLEQVLVNLVQNACQSLSDRDKAVQLEVSSLEDRDAVMIKVADEGCGIPDESMEKITDPFYTTRRDDGGTGLGLSVSTRIIEEHDGVMSISSEVGKGSTFTITLPVAG